MAGFSVGLAAALRANDIDVTNFAREHPFGYSTVDEYEPLPSVAFLVAIRTLLRRQRGSLAALARVGDRFLKRAERWIQAARIGRKHDVIVVSFLSPISGNGLEYALYRVLGCRVVVVAHGSEIRPAFLNGAEFGLDGDVNLIELGRRVRRQLRACRLAERFASEVIAFPGATHFFRGSVVDREIVGFPLLVQNLISASEAPLASGDPRSLSALENESPPTVILHAPSRAGIKGSESIGEICGALRQRGHRLEYRLLQDQSHAAVLRELGRAQIAVDQMWADVPGATFAREAALVGVPCVVGTYHATWLREHYGDAVMPSIVVHPDSVLGEVELLLKSRSARDAAIEASSIWSVRFGDLQSVGRRWRTALLGQAPQEWRFVSSEIDCAFAAYAPIERCRSVAAAFIVTFGLRRAGIPWRTPRGAAVARFILGADLGSLQGLHGDGTPAVLARRRLRRLNRYGRNR